MQVEGIKTDEQKMRLTKYNPETGLYEYKTRAKTLAEFQNQRKAAIQKLGFYEDIIEANFDLPDTKIGGNHHKLKVVEEKEDEQR